MIFSFKQFDYQLYYYGTAFNLEKTDYKAAISIFQGNGNVLN